MCGPGLFLDARGLVVMARDFSTVLSRRGYDDWGRSEGAWVSIGQGGRFTGQVALARAGFVNRNRPLSPGYPHP